MKIIITKTADEMGRLGAEMFAAQIRKKPDSVLGLATGSTPIPLYRELVRMYKEEGLDFSEVTTFNLDEYVGIAEDDPNSYHAFMNKHLLDHINIRKDNIHVPDGNSDDYDSFTASYEQAIRDAGGIDFQLLGIGVNGHIGFNEPGGELFTRTSLVQLTPSTIEANSRFFDSAEDVPKQAITMGMGTIFDAKKILVIASGLTKHAVIHKLSAGEFLSTNIPVSLLFLHPDCTLIVDEKAYYGY